MGRWGDEMGRWGDGGSGVRSVQFSRFPISDSRIRAFAHSRIRAFAHSLHYKF
ncbi:hypothetical protein [Moorena producens]|uniref:hypothetical protein n=1 Tax=Moorena producens TaxID=1155739 RepID=UPI003C7388C7